MIQLTRLNHVQFYLNPDLVEQIERTPDTVIRLTTGVRFVVVEPPEVVVDRIIAYRQRVVRGAISTGGETDSTQPLEFTGGEE